VRTHKTRELAVTREKVWSVVGDPYHEPRWWPLVQRVEGVSKRGWTSVSISSRGNAVRTDWHLEASEQPTRRRWTQEIEGTPFQKLFKSNVREVQLEKTASGTKVTLLFDQKIRGLGNVMPFLFKRAMRRQLAQALESLAQALED
jgi:carbon monoxide dehydrogenase subunit G